MRHKIASIYTRQGQWMNGRVGETPLNRTTRTTRTTRRAAKENAISQRVRPHLSYRIASYSSFARCSKQNQNPLPVKERRSSVSATHSRLCIPSSRPFVVIRLHIPWAARADTPHTSDISRPQRVRRVKSLTSYHIPAYHSSGLQGTAPKCLTLRGASRGTRGVPRTEI